MLHVREAEDTKQALFAFDNAVGTMFVLMTARGMEPSLRSAFEVSERKALSVPFCSLEFGFVLGGGQRDGVTGHCFFQ